ncbi:aminotransferase class IV [Actinoplanes cyaneus]|uniref:aminotransferase class IV n=1 Tax=Actinoplanes cyaneus TaxID=52696 RepID=UPI003F689D3E
MFIDHALNTEVDASVRVTVLPSPTDKTRTDVMMAVSDPVRDTGRPPLRVRTVQYERDLPRLKHMATLGLTFHCLEARNAGFDDVLFAGRDGSLSEGSAWNIAFWDGTQIVWPDGPHLAGITMKLLRDGLRELGVPDTSR